MLHFGCDANAAGEGRSEAGQGTGMIVCGPAWDEGWRAWDPSYSTLATKTPRRVQRRALEFGSLAFGTAQPIAM